MSLFFIPVNLNIWNMLEKVTGPGYEDTFLATNDMTRGHDVILYVGKQNPEYESGIYAVGKVLTEPYIVEESPDDYCNYKNSVKVEITKFRRDKPLMSAADCMPYITQFQSVHMLRSENEKEIRKWLGI